MFVVVETEKKRWRTILSPPCVTYTYFVSSSATFGTLLSSCISIGGSCLVWIYVGPDTCADLPTTAKVPRDGLSCAAGGWMDSDTVAGVAEASSYEKVLHLKMFTILPCSSARIVLFEYRSILRFVLEGRNSSTTSHLKCLGAHNNTGFIYMHMTI